MIAVVIWSFAILITIAVLVPINHRIAGLAPGPLPAGWREDYRRWDRLHRWRILLLVVAMLGLTYELLLRAARMG